jgi:hypothetical protein
MSSSSAARSLSHLRVVPSDRARDTPMIAQLRAVSLDARPCRPGEQPHRIKLACESTLARDAAAQAARDGVPPELWLRVVVEAARVRDDIAAIGLHPPSRVQRWLDAAAGDAGPVVPGCGELALYTRLLRSRSPQTPVRGNPPCLRIAVPDTMRAAWLAAAAEANVTLAAWVAARVRDAPGSAIAWEAAAAACGRELAEWGYRSWAARRADKADAQTLD